MEDIRRLDASQYAVAARLMAGAYPVMGVASDADLDSARDQMAKGLAEDQHLDLYGAFHADEMVGAMRLYEFPSNVFGTTLTLGGLGSVAVGIGHKKQGIGTRMVAWYLQECKRRGIPLAGLYSFRPDFYLNLGFGYGTVTQEFDCRITALPKGPTKNIVPLRLGDEDAMLACAKAMAESQHGMLYRRSTYYARKSLESHSDHVWGVRRDGELQGYVIFSFDKPKSDAPLTYDMSVHVLVYTNGSALVELLNFLRQQDDQVSRIRYTTQDESFHFLLSDPRDAVPKALPPLHHATGRRGIGMMYRIVDLDAVLRALPARPGVEKDFRLSFDVQDGFALAPKLEPKPYVVRRGKLSPMSPSEQAKELPEVSLQIGIGELSSLLMGAVPFRRLADYGLAKVSRPEFSDALDALFRSTEKPRCITGF